MSGNMHVNARSQGCPAECWIVITRLTIFTSPVIGFNDVTTRCPNLSSYRNTISTCCPWSSDAVEEQRRKYADIFAIHLLCSLWMRTHCRLFHSDWNYIGIGLLHRNTHIKHRKTHRLPVTLHFLAKGTLSKSRVAPVIGIGDLAPCRGFFPRCVKQ